MVIGGKVRWLRERAGLSQEDLAEKAGLTQKTICSIEAQTTDGRPSTRRNLAAALGVAVADLYKEA